MVIKQHCHIIMWFWFYIICKYGQKLFAGNCSVSPGADLKRWEERMTALFLVYKRIWKEHDESGLKSKRRGKKDETKPWHTVNHDAINDKSNCSCYKKGRETVKISSVLSDYPLIFGLWVSRGHRNQTHTWERQTGEGKTLVRGQTIYCDVGLRVWKNEVFPLVGTIIWPSWGGCGKK